MSEEKKKTEIVRVDYVTPHGRTLPGVRRCADDMVSGNDMGDHYGKQVREWLARTR